MLLKQVNRKEYPPEYPPMGGVHMRHATPPLMCAHMHCSPCASKDCAISLVPSNWFLPVDRKRFPAGAMSALVGGSLSYLMQAAG